MASYGTGGDQSWHAITGSPRLIVAADQLSVQLVLGPAIYIFIFYFLFLFIKFMSPMDKSSMI